MTVTTTVRFWVHSNVIFHLQMRGLGMGHASESNIPVILLKFSVKIGVKVMVTANTDWKYNTSLPLY